MRPEDEEILPSSAPDRSPPHSAEAEEHVIACCLLDGSDTLDRCINEGIVEEAFYFPANRLLYVIMLEMKAKGVVIMLETLAEELKTRRQLESINGFAYLMQVTGKIPTTAHAGYFIEKVREKYLLRELIKVATSAVEQAYLFTGGLEEFLSKVETDLMAVGQRRGVGLRNWKDAVDDAGKRFEEMLKANGSLAQGEVSWGFRDFDRAFEPMQPGQLVVLAARPSVGKSSLMRQVVLAAGLQEKPVPSFIATLEVKDYNIARHLAQTRSGVPYRRLKRHPNPADVTDFKQALAQIRGMPIHTMDDFSATSAKICAQARVLHARRKLGLICLDHLQEVPDGRGGEGVSTTEALGNVAKDLKALAGELDVPVLVLSQLNRASEHENRAPRLHDLRASGDIEQAADKVVFLHRPTVTPDGRPQSITSEVIDTPNFYVVASQAKGRDDGTGEVGVMFRRETATFFPIQHVP